MSRRQHGKGHKRPRAWHRSRSAGRKGYRALGALPATPEAELADPTLGAPQPVPRVAGKRYHPPEAL